MRFKDTPWERLQNLFRYKQAQETLRFGSPSWYDLGYVASELGCSTEYIVELASDHGALNEDYRGATVKGGFVEALVAIANEQRSSLPKPKIPTVIEKSGKQKIARTPRTVPARMRYRVLERDGHKCSSCGATAQEAKLHVDHIVPYSKGGETTMDNLRALCADCNIGKGALMPATGIIQ